MGTKQKENNLDNDFNINIKNPILKIKYHTK